MSIAIELSRIQTDRNTIRTKLVELGMATGTANLDALVTAIDGIVNQGASATTVRCTGFYRIIPRKPTGRPKRLRHCLQRC